MTFRDDRHPPEAPTLPDAPSAPEGGARVAAPRHEHHALLDDLDAVVWEADAHSPRVDFVSAGAERMLGYPPARWYGEPGFWEERVVHPEDREWVLAHARAARRQERDYQAEYRVRTAAGETLWVADRVKMVRDAEGRVVRVRGMTVNVTGQIGAEERLSFQAALLAAQGEASLDASVVVSNERMLLSYNRRFVEMWRCPDGVMESRDGTRVAEWMAAQLVDPAAFRARIDGYLAAPVVTDDFELELLDGRIVETHVRAVRDADKHYGRVWFLRDVTERRRARQALQESEERFRQLAESIDSNFWLFDLAAGRTIYTSPAYERIFGLPREAQYADPRAWQATLHPDEADYVRRTLEAKVGGAYEVIYRIVRPNGERRWLRDRGFPIADAEGRVYRAAGVTEDITRQYEAELRVRGAEMHYRRLVTTSPFPIYAVDAAGRFTELNPAGERLLGRTAAELQGVRFEEVVDPRDVGPAAAALADLMDGRTDTLHLETGVLRPGGELRRIAVSATTIREGGRVVGVHGIARDVTEERAAEEQRRFLSAALESLPEAVAINDDAGRLVYWNRAFAALLQAPAAARGRPVAVTDLLPDAESAEQLARIGRWLDERELWKGRVSRRRLGDGAVVTLDTVMGRVEVREGERHYFILGHDAAETLRREEHVRRAERLASIGTLVSGVAHELNNPLAAIRALAQLLLADGPPAAVREGLEVIGREADRAGRIVADLRGVARASQAEGEQAREPVDLDEVVRHVLKLRGYALATHNVQVRTELAGSLPPVPGDRGQLEQVVLNLVVNAEQAMAGSAGPVLTLATRAEGPAAVSLTVRDTGEGIAPQDQARIFDPFFTTKGPGDGTGLGLSLVNGIVSAHGGQVHVESSPGAGAAFRVVLPAGPASISTLSARFAESVESAESAEPAPSAESTESRGSAGSAASAEPAPVPSFESAGRRPGIASTSARATAAHRVLLVEDEEAIRRTLSRFLARRGYAVDLAADGAEALRAVESAAQAGDGYRLILSDLRMPGMGGDALFQRLRARGGGWAERMMFLTGDAVSADASHFLSTAGVPVLYKPFDLEDVARRVAERIAFLSPATADGGEGEA